MGLDAINENQKYLQTWIAQEKERAEKYYADNPNSLIPKFEAELRMQGFDFEVSSQVLGFLPQHKSVILPLAVKYYLEAKKNQMDNEQNHFLCFFHFKGFDEVVPMLVEDFKAPHTNDLTRWLISDCLLQIRSKKYADDYVDIISNPQYGCNRQMLILLIGKLKYEAAIPILLSAVEDEQVQLQVLSALGEYRRSEFLQVFERFSVSQKPALRKAALHALKKIK